MDDITNATARQLRAFIERIERLEEERRGLGEDVRDVYGEAKGNGFEVRAMRKIVAMRRQDAGERQAQEEVLSLYLRALGMEG